MFAGAGLVGLAWMDGGTRNLYTKKAVRKPADLAGQKVRMMGNPLFVDTMNAMGGSGVSMGMAELFSSMQTGVRLLRNARPDMVELLPGLVPKAIRELKQALSGTPVYSPGDPVPQNAPK